ncbi:MAG: guanitoxin biosynthesis PLP-dependent (S)-gamma-hydroxy-L-arginine cyclodehydratase GntC [Methanobacteriaceae archaeon]
MFRPSRRVSSIDLSGIRKMFELITEDTINLGLGEPDFDTPPHIIGAAKNSMDEGFTHYTVNKGIIELRDAVSNKLKTENRIKTDPESIIVTVGASEALYMCSQAFFESGDEVLIPDPGFVSYAACVRLAEAKPVPIKLEEDNEFRMTAEAVNEKISPETKAIILNSPSNPTGSVMKKSDIKGIAELADDHGFLIVSDEIYEKIIYQGRHYSFGEFSDNVITINGFSKTYAMTGFRIAYTAARPEITEEMLKIHQYNTACASSISQIAALEALTGPQKSVEVMVTEFKRRRDLIVRRLNDMGIRCVKPAGAFYVFPHVRNADEYVSKALENGVIVVPGQSFGENSKEYVRMSYATSYENIEEAMDRLEQIEY